MPGLISNGTKTIRSNKVTIINNKGEIPSIAFSQQVLAEFDDGQKMVIGVAPDATALMNDPSTTFNLINPEDNTTVLGTATYQDLYIMVYSLYFKIITDNPSFLGQS
jgi:hypothetical protein